MTELVVILNSFNRAALLQDALDSLRDKLTSVASWALVVFEAGSTDDSRQIIDRFCEGPNVCAGLIEPGAGDGSFAAGVNAAMRFAFNKFPQTKYFLLFETDNCLRDGQVVRAAIRLMEAHPDLGAAGFTVRTHQGARTGYGCPFPSLLSFVLGQQIPARLGLDQPRPTWRRDGEVVWSRCDAVYTSPLLVRRDAWERTGGLDSETFPFSDCDLDWAWRLARAGLAQAVIETDSVIHDNRQQLSAWSANRAIHSQTARRRLIERLHGGVPRWVEPLILLRQGLELMFLALLPSSRGEYKTRVRKRWLLLRQNWGVRE